jgi:predicted nucleic acid-binding protein
MDIKYCLDSNVLIQAWQRYYSPAFCSEYWNVLKQLGKDQTIFISENVYEEIVRTEDELSNWLKLSKIPVNKIDSEVSEILKKIFDADPKHKFLVDNIKMRSLADPWVIAHAMRNNAVVVTKEEKVLSTTTNKIKIPNVCETMKVRCINDFQMIQELDIRFNCKISNSS